MKNELDRQTGTVKSWNGERGFGFIQAPGLAGDAMFMRTDLPLDVKEVRGKFLDGRVVTFVLNLTTGKVKATEVELVLTGAEDEFLAGTIKSFSDRHGYGFISSSMVEGDVRFQAMDLQSLSPGVNPTGQLVIFQRQAMPDGKLRANKVMFQSKKIAENQSGNGGAMTIPSWGGGGGGMSGAASKGSKGSPKGAYGGGGGGADKQMATMMNMMPMMAQLMGGKGSQAQLQNMMKGLGGGGGGGGGVPPAKRQRTEPKGPVPAVHAMGQSMSGTIKSYNAEKRFGFITGPQLPSDAFFMMTDLPQHLQNFHGDMLQGKWVTFEWAQTADGKVRAQNVTA